MNPQDSQKPALSEEQMGKVIGDLLAAASKDEIESNRATTGACQYRCGLTYCCKAGVTESWCDKVNGTWTKHGSCP